MKKFIVITTINDKTRAISDFERKKDWHIIIVGDRRSQSIESTNNLTFLSVHAQQNLGFSITDKLPYNHYTRKNIGYLYAIRAGADVIYETDDDNIPYPYWGIEPFKCKNLVQNESVFVNIYNHFSKNLIWPRGFPLDLISNKEKPVVNVVSELKVGVWQGLADLDPDVDAIYRLIFDKPVRFQRKRSVILPPGKFCPFNSQNTLWNREAFPYLYLPATTSFRFTDILRGFIAQRLMWESGMHLGFHQATVYQVRNIHDLMRDFKDEVECYLSPRKVINVITGLNFSDNPFVNLALAYRGLVEEQIISSDELRILDAWRTDLEQVY